MNTTTNFPLVVTFAAIMIAQLVKYPIAVFFKKPNANFSIIHATGGMPSSHSAAVTSLITALILQHGFFSPIVAIAVCFGMIVMFDAMGVRRQDGEQGVLIYTLMKILKEKARETGDTDLLAKLNTLDEDRMVINDYLGHKPSEVIGGMTTGVLVTLGVRFIYILLNLPL